LIRKKKKQIFHVHWEEHCLRPCPTAAEARSAKDYFVKRTRYFQKLGGKVLWTVHNLMPHELEHVDIFLGLRQELADIADHILVHNLEAINVLADQITFDSRKIRYLPHASYQGVYPAPTEADAGVKPSPRTLLAFGKVRRYKGFDTLLDLLPPAFMKSNKLSLKIVGQPLETETFGEELTARAAGRKDVTLDFRVVPDDEVSALLTSAGCVVLPYERFLTSGVALLCLSAGALVVAPAAPSMKELLPPSCHRLLYKAGDIVDIQRAVLECVTLTDEERNAMVQDSLSRANYLRPERISRQLGEIYDRLL
jgi:glycosyltransferase involved in cell wall biosynthesis